eukprot:2803143-Pleurochrysis_carterae.AAC.1
MNSSDAVLGVYRCGSRCWKGSLKGKRVTRECLRGSEWGGMTGEGGRGDNTIGQRGLKVAGRMEIVRTHFTCTSQRPKSFLPRFLTCPVAALVSGFSKQQSQCAIAMRISVPRRRTTRTFTAKPLPSNSHERAFRTLYWVRFV